MGLVLASASPRRRELMRMISPDFTVDVAEIEESAIAGKTPAALAENIALAKARAVAARRSGNVVVGCDTVVELKGETFGKPLDAQNAARMIRALAGKRHHVHTGVCVLLPDGRQDSFVQTTSVDFCEISSAEIAAYAATKEPMDKAGGYGIQGWAARHVVGIQGCYYNVMGLPVSSLYHRLLQLGVLQQGNETTSGFSG